MFHAEEGGRFWVFLTEKAIAFGQGQPDRLAAVTLARWLSEFQIEYHWHEDLSFTVEPHGRVTARASRLSDTDKVSLPPEGDYTFAVQLSGTIEPVARIAGGTFRQRWDELSREYPDGIPLYQLARPWDWLRGYPIHWTPCAEVAQAKTLAAGAAG